MSWTTAKKTQNPVVQYGTQPGVYTANASAAFDQYTQSDMCGGIASAQGWIEPGELPHLPEEVLSQGLLLTQRR